MKVLNIGSLNYDNTYEVDHMVRAGETLSSNKMQVFCGGKGLNQSIALAKAGINVWHGGMVGEDGQRLLDTCKKNGVNTKYIKQIAGRSGNAIIQVDKTGQNCILLYGGSNQELTKSYIGEILNDFRAGDFLLLQNEVNELDYIIECAYSKKMEIILNPSPYDNKLEQCDFNKISIFIMNEIEGEQMTGQKLPDDILEAMIKKYPKAKVVLTLGEEGVIYFENGEKYYQSAYKVKAIDTTAAGDTFTGYFLAGYINGIEIENILEQSVKASAITVSRKGATISIPTKDELELFCLN